MQTTETEYAPEDTASKEETIKDQIADYLRALHLTCRLLIGILENCGISSVTTAHSIPANSSLRNRLINAINSNNTAHPHTQKQEILEQTRRRCKLLLRILWEQQSRGLKESEHKILNLDSLQDDSIDIQVVPLEGQPGLYSYSFRGNGSDETDSDDDGCNLLSLDRKVLEAEEQTLIWMASTPIPGEIGNEDEKPPGDCSPAANLEGQLQTEWSKEMYELCQERRHKRQRMF